MRLLLIGFTLAFVATLAVAFEAGRRVEAEYRAAVLALGSDDDLAVVIDHYDRGLFFSEATTLVEPMGEERGEPVRARLALHHRIEHGPYPTAYLFSDAFDGKPIIAQARTELVLEIEDEEAIEEVPLPVLVDAVFSWAEGATLQVTPDVEAGALEDPELSADWEAIQGTATFAYDGSSFSGAFEIPRLAFDGEAVQVHIAGLRFEYDYESLAAVGAGGAGTSRVAAALIGHSRFSLDAFSLADGEDSIFLRGLEFENSSEVSEGTWSMQVDAGVESVGEPDTAAGPRGGELSFRVSGLALEPLDELASVGAVVEAEPLGSDAMKMELLGAAGALWPRLMAPGPEFELSRLRLATPEGEIRMYFRVGVDPTAPGATLNPFATVPALEVDFELSLPEPILEGWLAVPRPLPSAGGSVAPWVRPAEFASERVGTWLERGHLDRHDGSYVTSVRIRSGTVRLNGRVVSFDAL